VVHKEVWVWIEWLVLSFPLLMDYK
jgi:hypothetical protein